MKVLLTRWRAQSVALGWLAVSDWWSPACDALAEAMVVGRSPLAVVARLGAARAELGCGIEETIDDVTALWHVCTGGDPPLEVVRAVAGGWADTGLLPIGADSCIDQLTRLTTRAYLEARLAELYRDGRPGRPAERYCLLVVDIGKVHTLADLGAISRVAEALRRTCTNGETLARLGPGRAVALCEAGPDLAMRLAMLEGLVQNPELGKDLHAAIWVESLPRAFSLVQGLLFDLSR